MTFESKSQFIIGVVALLVASACSANPPRDTCGPAVTTCAAAQPDRQKTLAHIKEHVTYPATRRQILAACAQTKEFSESEKQWIADNLPEGTYANSDDVARTLKL
jgi:hypothetical protein